MFVKCTFRQFFQQSTGCTVSNRILVPQCKNLTRLQVGKLFFLRESSQWTRVTHLRWHVPYCQFHFSYKKWYPESPNFSATDLEMAYILQTNFRRYWHAKFCKRWFVRKSVWIIWSLTYTTANLGHTHILTQFFLSTPLVPYRCFRWWRHTVLVFETGSPRS